MKRNKLFLMAVMFVVFAWCGSSYAQWTFCNGSSSLTGLGTNPSISVASPLVVWVCGGASNAPKIMRSTDGGVTFTNVTGNMTATPEPWCIWAVDANTAFAGDGGAAGGTGGNAKLWKTTNGGTTWAVVLNTGGTVGFFNEVIFSRSNPSFGFAESDPPTGAGGNYYLAITTDAGATWNVTNPPGVSGQASSQNGADCVDSQLFGFGLGNTAPARVRITTNGGTTWSLASTAAISGGFVSGFAINSLNRTTMLMVTGDPTGSSLPNIARSTDAGATWTAVNTGAGLTGAGLLKYVPGTNVAYLSGPTGTNIFRKSTNDGVTWTNMTTTPPGITGTSHMQLVYVGGTVTAYAICADGSCLQLIDNILAVDPNNSSIPTSYALEQNYPNPFNPTTTIRYSLPKASNVSIKIYDVLGNEVMTVVKAYQNAGNYTETVDASNLSSGVYFYAIKAGDFTATKKMSLIK